MATDEQLSPAGPAPAKNTPEHDTVDSIGGPQVNVTPQRPDIPRPQGQPRRAHGSSDAQPRQNPPRTSSRRNHTSESVHGPTEPEVTVMCGREVLECIGVGVYGKVYRAREIRTGERQVIKATQASEFAEQEAMILRQLPDHPYIIQLHHHVTTRHHVYLFMQYGGPCNLYHTQLSNDGHFETHIAVDVFGDVLQAVIHIHENNVCHLDIKPENVIVGEDEKCRLTDFGLAAYLSHPVQRGAGSLPFAAPEVLDTMARRRTNYQGDLADRFSMGVLLFELCFGINSMKKALGWSRRGTNDPLQDPAHLATQMREGLHDTDALCKRAFRHVPILHQPDELILTQAFQGMLSPVASTRTSLINIASWLNDFDSGN
eukprot:gnl/MRDRNA2_/MRDRNA2_29895_c0_seq1.p1 gnl/MRDRNA2_/MRDRNA2_29895_c0~~gnl/MRDRNA2_/MRDRNA2_29895_c0_seq1.p1  ORF type:complete len:373 (+),score=57.31 gnl/MRDRNA2_/MRDRNA2_29895_c0_seq1:87-1205(+)